MIIINQETLPLKSELKKINTLISNETTKDKITPMKQFFFFENKSFKFLFIDQMTNKT